MATPPSTRDDPRRPAPGDNAARVEKYAAWKAHLEGVLADYLRRMPLYRRAFGALTGAGVVCFAFGVFPGLWGTFSATLVSVGGYAMLKSRVWELQAEIREIDAELERLAKQHIAPSSPR